MIAVADWIGAHALFSLVLLIVLLLLVTAALWRTIERHSESLWHVTSKLWQQLVHSRIGRVSRGVPWINAAWSRSLTVSRYLGAHVLIGFAIAVGSLWLFLEIAEGIGFNEKLGRFDEALSSSLRVHLEPQVLQPFAYFTHLGDRSWLAVISGVVAVVLLVMRKYLFGVGWLIAAAGGGMLNQTLKALFHRTRPFHNAELFVTHGYSFPSGHAQGSMIVYGMLAYLLIRHTARPWHLPITVAALSLIVLVGCSRIILQVHYFSDVIAGFTAAIAWLAICIAGMEITSRHRSSRTHR